MNGGALILIGVGAVLTLIGTIAVKRKQAGVLLLIAAAIFLAIGLGYDPRTLIGR